MVPREQLRNADASRDDIVKDIHLMFSTLSPNNPRIRKFMRNISKAPHVPHVISPRSATPTTWASIDPVVDAWWDDGIEDEPISANAPFWLQKGREKRVKCSGSFESPLLTVGTFPLSYERSVHPNFATADDLSDKSINLMIHKMGYSRPTDERPSMAALHWVPIRIDAEDLPFKKSSSTLMSEPFNHTPVNLREYWTEHVWKAIRLSKANVILLIGTRSFFNYRDYLVLSGIRHEKVKMPKALGMWESWVALLEKGWDGEITRIALSVNPPNHKNHMRSFKEVDPKVHRMVINERLYDLASIYLDDSELRPAFFSSVGYLQAFPVGLYVSITSIKAADKETLRSIFKVPNGQAFKVARTFIQQHPAFSVAEKAKVLAAMKASVISQGKDANTFWQLKSTVTVYGPHAVTYRLMNTRVMK